METPEIAPITLGPVEPTPPSSLQPDTVDLAPPERRAMRDPARLGAPGPAATYIHFELHEESGRVVFKVLDAETGEVIRQVPPEEVIKVAEHIRAYLRQHVHDGER